MKNIIENIGYQTLLQVLNTCLPLITSPYLSRVLKAEGLGVFSYTQSVVNYFVLIAMLGVISYGTREIAICRNNKKERSETFWNIYALQLFMSLISLIIYIVYIVFFLKENIGIAWFQIFYIIASIFDITWLFFGLEDFKRTVKISTLIRLVSVGFILIFVKSIDDLWIYTFIMSGGVFFGNILLWVFLFKVIDVKEIKNIKIKKMIKHIKPNLVLFIPLLGMSVYHIMDKTMLGILSSYRQIGYYYNADKVINIPIGIITGIGTVMLPHITSVINSGNKKEADQIFKLSIEMIIALSVAIGFGISAISFKFVPLFFGEGFDNCISLIIALSPVLLIKGLSHTFRMQYLIPNFKEKIFIESVFIGAIINLLVNIILIPKLAAMGAVLGTIAAEIATCLWQFIYIFKEIEFVSVIKRFFVYNFFGIIMFVTIYFIGSFVSSNITAIVVEIIVGIIIYGGFCTGYWLLTENPIIIFILNSKRKNKEIEK